MSKYLRDPVTLVFFAIGSAIILGALGLAWSFQKVESWPKVAAEVVSSKVVKNSYARHEGQVEVKVDGKALTLTTNDTTDPLDIEETIAEWKPGTVLVLPQNPENSEDLRLPVEPIMMWLPWILAAGGLAFILIPVGVVALSERKGALRIVGGIFAASGVLFMVIGSFMTYRKTQILKTWPEVEATIAQSEVGRRSGNRRVHRGVDLVVDYRVDGQAVRTAVGQRGSTMDIKAVEQAVATTYAPGQKVRLRYQPSQPKRATFEAAWSLAYFWEALVFLGVGLSTLLLGGLISRYLKD